MGADCADGMWAMGSAIMAGPAPLLAVRARVAERLAVTGASVSKPEAKGSWLEGEVGPGAAPGGAADAVARCGHTATKLWRKCGAERSGARGGAGSQADWIALRMPRQR